VVNEVEKTERNYASPIPNLVADRTKKETSKFFLGLQLKLENLLFQSGLLILITGFLLGRALILMEIMPFALPFVAAVYVMKKEKLGVSALAVLGGAFTISVEKGAFVLLCVFAFLILYKVSGFLSVEPARKLPLIVFVTMLIVNLSLSYTSAWTLTVYDVTLAVVESGLSFILTMIFLQSIPLISQKINPHALKIEEVICLIILLASVMTGTTGWEIYGLSIEHILSRYLVIVFAFVAGATVGSTVGVVTGLILSLANVSSLYEMSLLAFSGLLGGLLKDGKKLGVSLGLIVGTLLISLYSKPDEILSLNLYESLVAVGLFLLTPKGIIGKISKLVPGTAEHSNEQQQYLRKVRDVTANRVEQFSNVFEALSSSFSKNTFYDNEQNEEKEVDYFLSNVTEKTCQLCFKKEQCWGAQIDTTYDYMTEIMQEVENGTMKTNQRLNREWDKHCVKSKKMIETMEKELTYFYANKQLKQQIIESRKIVAEQLSGVSQVMKDFADEIQKERQHLYVQEEQIVEALKGFGIEVNQIEIYNLEQGNVDIEMWVPYCEGRGECEKLIAPLLSDILNETVIVKEEKCAPYPQGYCHASFCSAQAYVVETGVAHAAKGGGFISGDSYSIIELSRNKHAIAISDGMGNGERAHCESTDTLQLLKQILKTGIEEKMAIKSVNSILALRTNEEMYSTLDLAMVDLQDANAKFLKIGSIPSFIKRGNKIIKIQANNLPIGIIDEFEVDVVSEKLKAGDLLIMMSDGVFEGPRHVENYEMWMKRKISEIETDHPQEVADIIMEEVIRTKAGVIDDDMTVVVTKIQHNIPKWSSIPVHSQAQKQA
jgi:stage II sporulation protein E